VPVFSDIRRALPDGEYVCVPSAGEGTAGLLAAVDRGCFALANGNARFQTRPKLT